MYATLLISCPAVQLNAFCVYSVEKRLSGETLQAFQFVCICKLVIQRFCICICRVNLPKSQKRIAIYYLESVVSGIFLTIVYLQTVSSQVPTDMPAG